MFTKVSTEGRIEIVEALAKEIWPEHYTPIIGKAQVEYMLERFQLKQAILEQIKAGARYFLIEEGGQFIGYIGFQLKGDEIFLSKIYVKSSHRLKGYGKKAIQFLEKIAKNEGMKKIVLTVNKNNKIAIRAYEKTGFKNIGSIVQEIGGDFVMDDYRMEKSV